MLMTTNIIGDFVTPPLPLPRAVSGNKIRKGQFLLAEALEKKHNCILTAGGAQSNHAKSMAVAARQLGFEHVHLMLRLDGYSEEEAAKAGTPELEIGLHGNLFFDRMMNAQIHAVSPGTYVAHGGADPLLVQLAQKLRETEGLNPYVIPVGGSNALGTWGYLDAAEEIRHQLAALLPSGKTADASGSDPAGDSCCTHHIVFASGSGGTAAGLVIGCFLAGLLSEDGAEVDGVRVKVRLHGVTVCDDPDYFYDHIDRTADEMLQGGRELHGFSARNNVTFYYGNGIGYGQITDEALDYLMKEIVCPSGIVFDHCYSGKAVSYLVRNLQVGAGSTVFEPTSGTDIVSERKVIVAPGDRVIMLHTGGALGSFCRGDQIASIISRNSSASNDNYNSSSGGGRYHQVKRFDPIPAIPDVPTTAATV